jgi:hypothetical protein
MGDISILLSGSLAIASVIAATSLDSTASSGRRITFACTRNKKSEYIVVTWDQI